MICTNVPLSHWGRFSLGQNVPKGTHLKKQKGEKMLEKGKFTEIDEEFICDNCGRKVPKLGYSCRNHCPYCLHSKHVDKNPGDRQEQCHGDLEPVSLEINGKKGYVIVFKCKKCGAIRKNKAAKDDNMDLLIDLSGKQI